MSAHCSCDLPTALHADADGLHTAGGRRLAWFLDDTAYDEPGPASCCCGLGTPVLRYRCAEHGTEVCKECFEHSVTLSRCTCAARTAA